MNRTTRNLTWLGSTLTVVVLLFGYKTSTGGSAGSASAVIGTNPAQANGSARGSGGLDGSGGAADDTAGAAGGVTTGSASTVVGDVAQTRWGPVQVAVSVAHGKVTDVQVVDYPHGNPRDAEINASALPILVGETRSAQSAHIDMVSGATVTSEGYVESLQSALDRAGL